MTTPEYSLALARWVFVGVVALATSFIVVTFVGRWRARPVDADMVEISERAIPAVRHLSRARSALHRFDVDFDAAALGDASARQRLSADRESLDSSLGSHEALGDFPDEQPLRATARAAFEVLAEGARIASAGDAPIDAAAVALEHSASLRLDGALEQMVERDATHALELGDDARQRRRATRNIVTALDAATFGLGLVAAALAATLLRRAMSSLEGARAAAHTRALQLEARSTELDQFAGRVAHDVMGPLSATVLALDFVHRKYASDERVRAIVQRGLAGVNRSRLLVDGLLEFARAGARPEPGARCGLVEIVEDVVSSARADASAAKVELVTDVTAPVELACSAAVLTSIVSNLVRNAVKHMGDAPVRLVRVRAEARRTSYRLLVEDTGPGVPPGKEQAIFEPFVRGGTHVPGAGLGLATVQRLARAHGGEAGCMHREVGMTFWVDLPQAAPSGRASADAGTAPREPPALNA